MKNIILSIVILMTFNSKEENITNSGTDYVPDKETSIKIAEAIWIPIYGETVTKWRIDKNGADEAPSVFETTDVPGIVGSTDWSDWYGRIKRDSRIGRPVDYINTGGYYDARSFLHGGKIHYTKSRPGTVTGWMRIDTVQASADFSTDPVFEAPGKSIGMDNPSFK
mgnify:CR=1 FL=1